MNAITLPTLVDAKLTLEDRVAVLTLNRDDVRNILTGTSLTDDIVNTASWVNACPEVSALIITGAGAAFSAGGNIKDMRDRQGIFGGDIETVQRRYREGIQRIPLAIETIEVPVIAAINGPAIGAGFDLALMCDIRLATADAKMGETFVNLGIVPGDGGAWYLQRLIGYQLAADLTFSGRVIDASEAKDMGIVLEVTQDYELMPKALEMAKVYAQKPPQALRFAKYLMKTAYNDTLVNFLDVCGYYQGVCHNTEDHHEAVSAFIEKRKPVFKGR